MTKLCIINANEIIYLKMLSSYPCNMPDSAILMPFQTLAFN